MMRHVLCPLFLSLVYFLETVGTSRTNLAIILTTPKTSVVRHVLAAPAIIYQKWDNPFVKGNIQNKEIEKSRNLRTDQFVHIDYNYKTRTFFITNIGARVIKAYDIRYDQYRPRTVFEGISKQVKGLAVDWVHGTVYWLDPAYSAIFSTTDDGNCRRLQCASVIVGTDLEKANGLAVQPYSGRLYWTNGQNVESSSLDGSNRTQLVTNLTRPQGLCIDYDKHRLYWIDVRGTDSVVESSDMEGRHRTLVMRQPDSRLFDIDIHRDYLVATDQRSHNVVIHDVHDNTTLQKPWAGKPFGVVIDGKAMPAKEPTHNMSAPPVLTNRGFVLLASSTGIDRMERNFAELDKGDNLQSIFPGGREMAVDSLTSDSHTGIVYYYEYSTKTIRRIKSDFLRNEGEGQSMMEVLTDAVGKVADLAFDWITKNLYWTDRTRGQIMVSRDDGRFPYVVVERNVKEPRSLALDPLNRYMFWSDGTDICWAELDGARMISELGVPSLFQTHGLKTRLAVDVGAGRLYWSDGRLLYSTRYLGPYVGRESPEHHQLANSYDTPVSSLHVMNDYIIYSETLGGVFAQDKKDFTDVGRSHSTKIFHDITYHHVSHQPRAHNKCTKRWNGGCEHLCLPNNSPKGYICACTVGYWLQSDGSCVPGLLMEPYLVFPDRRRHLIYQASLILDINGVFNLQMLKDPVDVAFDPLEQKIYWTDDQERTISCAYVNGSHQHIVYADRNVHPKNIALDVASKLIYYVDIHGNVGVVSLINGAHHVVIDRHHIEAVDVALDPNRGVMFITGRTPMLNASANVTEYLQAVTMADMDGRQLVQIASGLGSPRGVTVTGDSVVWADGERRTVEQVTRVKPDSWNRSVLAHHLRGRPIDVVADSDYVYWTETEARFVKRAPLRPGTTQDEYLASRRFFDLAGLALSPERYNTTSECQGLRCNGSAFCLPTPRGRVCRYQSRPAYDPRACQNGSRNCTDRERYMQQSFCSIPFLENGRVLNASVGTYVPVGFKTRLRCNIGFKVVRSTMTRESERYITLKANENECLSSGRWLETYQCEWALSYKIQGNFARGHVIFHNSGRFLVPPGIRRLDVICIGGGGGGYSPGKRRGDGGTSRFGRHLRSGGGRGGREIPGGGGGFGYVYQGGSGGDRATCRYGGAAGQMGHNHSVCFLNSANCPYCGAGGYMLPCPHCPHFKGACSGPWAEPSKGLNGSNYGGGAGSIEGGSGGGAGYSRKRWMRVKPETIISVTVGKGGYPSSAPPGDGIVVVAWGGAIESFLPKDEVWFSRCPQLHKNCSCVQKDAKHLYSQSISRKMRNYEDY